MKKTVRQTVLIETEQVSILLDHSRHELMFCTKCGPGFAMLQPEQLARLAGLQVREIYRLVESGNVHFVDRDDVHVCLESLIALDKGNGGEK